MFEFIQSALTIFATGDYIGMPWGIEEDSFITNVLFWIREHQLDRP